MSSDFGLWHLAQQRWLSGVLVHGVARDAGDAQRVLGGWLARSVCLLGGRFQESPRRVTAAARAIVGIGQVSLGTTHSRLAPGGAVSIARRSIMAVAAYRRTQDAPARSGIWDGARPMASEATDIGQSLQGWREIAILPSLGQSMTQLLSDVMKAAVFQAGLTHRVAGHGALDTVAGTQIAAHATDQDVAHPTLELPFQVGVAADARAIERHAGVGRAVQRKLLAVVILEQPAAVAVRS